MEDASKEIDIDLNDEKIDYLEVDELKRFTAHETSSSENSPIPLILDESDDEYSEAVKDNTKNSSQIDNAPKSLGLTLEYRTPDVEKLSIIGGDLEPLPEMDAEQEKSPSSEEDQEVTPAPIRASRDESENAEKSFALDTVQKKSKPLNPKFAEEAKKRSTARAVFTAKQKSKVYGGRKKLIAVVALIALIPLAGGGYLLLESTGIFASGNRYGGFNSEMHNDLSSYGRHLFAH